MKDKKIIPWIYELRGILIIFVAVAHMQGTLHASEYIQFLTIHTIASLYFLTGYTKWLSLSKALATPAPEGTQLTPYQKMMKEMWKSIWKVLAPYMVYVYISVGNANDWFAYLSTALAFRGPAYFIRNYFLLTLMAPIMYLPVAAIMRKVAFGFKQKILLSLYVIAWFWIGYYTGAYCGVQSYFAVYAAGLAVAAVQTDARFVRPQTVLIKIRNWVISLAVLAFGAYEAFQFYFARVAGDLEYAGGIDRFTSGLQLNPPNLSTIVYSAGVVAVAYQVFSLIDESKIPWLHYLAKPFNLLGRYSLDIYFWHMIIALRICLPLWLPLNSTNVALMRLFFFTSMLGLPILGRKLWEKFKKTFNGMFALENK